MANLNLEVPTSSIYSDFERQCLQMEYVEPKLLLQKGAAFVSATQGIQNTLYYFYSDLAQIPFLSTILIWAKKVSEDKVFGSRYIGIMQDLVLSKLVPTATGKTFISLESYASISHDEIINTIRSRYQWHLQKREESVSLYITFANWLAETSVGYIKRANDPDRCVTSKRRLSFEKYLELLSCLPDREKIIAKLFYLGGERSLDDILSLRINEIHFDRNCVYFAGKPIDYPRHLMEDIKVYLGARKNGFVFANVKCNDRIHHTVPYRILKKAANSIGLPESFSYKNLVENI